MSVHAIIVCEDDHVAKWHTAYPDMTIAGADQCAPGNEHVAGLGFLYFDSATLIQAAREHLGESFRHVLDYDDAAREVAGELCEHVLQCVWTAGGDADSNDLGRRRLWPYL